jgi:hypothetical protein
MNRVDVWIDNGGHSRSCFTVDLNPGEDWTDFCKAVRENGFFLEARWYPPHVVLYVEKTA